MSFVKSVCGFLINSNYNINEGEISPVDTIDYMTKKWAGEGKLVIFDTYEEAISHTFTPSHVLAAQSLASLNPGVSAKGEDLTAPAPTFDFNKEAPIKLEAPVIPEVKVDTKEAIVEKK